MTESRHRLEGLEPDNLLAFLALVGLMRALDASGELGAARIAWSVDAPPVRPVLHLPDAADRVAVLRATARGIRRLTASYTFDRRGLAFTSDEGRERLLQAREDGTADLWAALLSDAAVSRDNQTLRATPLCLQLGAGHQHFLTRLAEVPALAEPPSRRPRRRGPSISEECSLAEALFRRWRRPDATQSFRWDHQEDLRYALRATNPADPTARATTQHGANRLAAVGLPVFVVAPERGANGRVRLGFRSGGMDAEGRRTVTWPIWRHPLRLATLVSLLDHPALDDAAERHSLGVTELRRATRFINGHYMNVTPATPI